MEKVVTYGWGLSQVRFPKSKKKRIRKKWSKNANNYGLTNDKVLHITKIK